MLLAVSALLVALMIGARLVSVRTPRVEETAVAAASTASPHTDPRPPMAAAASTRENVAEPVTADSTTVPATAAITGRLQINGFAARRGRVRIRTEAGDYEQELVVDPYGRFYVEGVPAGELRIGFEAEGLFERQLVLPDRYPFVARAGELEVLDLDWWTRQVNVFIGGEEGELRAAEVELSGPGYGCALQVDEGGILRLDLVGQGIFTFHARTRDRREDSAALEFEEGDELDTVALVPRVKNS